MKYSHLLVLIFFISAGYSYSQVSTIGGIILTVENQPLSDVSIIVNSDRLISTNEDGQFSINSSDFINNQCHLFISLVGCNNIDTLVRSDVEKLVFTLDCSNILGEVVLKSFYPIKRQTATVIPLSRIKSNPSLTGEFDVLKTIQSTAGANFSVEGSSDIVVRGGSVGENQIYYNGVDLYNNAHLFGLVSQYSSNLINNVNFYKTGIPAKYGGKLSSVLDIETKNFDQLTPESFIKLGLVSSSFFVSKQIKPKIKFALEGRRTLLDALAHGYYEIFEPSGSYVPNFYDLSGTSIIKLNEKSEFSLWAGYSKDRSIDRDEGNRPDFRNYINTWSNTYFSLNYDRKTERILLKTSLAYADYDSELREEELFNSVYQDAKSKGRYKSLQFNIDILTKFNNTWALNFGTNMQRKSYETSFLRITDTVDIFQSKFDNVLNVVGSYLSLNFENPHSSSFVGVRFTSLPDSKFKTYVEPRFYLDYRLGNHKFFSSGSIINQLEFLNYSTSIGNYLKVWTPIDINEVAPNSKEISIGYGINFDNTELSIEGYLKERKNLYHTKAGENVLYFNDGFNSLDKNGIGTAKGIELSIRSKLSSKTSLDASFSVSNSKLEFSHINGGEEFDDYFDRLFNLKLFVQHHFNKKWTLNSQFTYLSGTPFTYYPGTYPYITSKENLQSQTESNGGNLNIFIYSGLNNKRLPSHHRLDILALKKIEKKGKLRELSFGVYNVYGRINPFYVEQEFISYSEDENLRVKYNIISYFNVIPNFSYTIYF